MLRHLYTDHSIKSLEVETDQKYPLTSVFDFGPMKLHDFWQRKT